MHWPSDPPALERLQLEIASSTPPPWSPFAGMAIGACFVCFRRGERGVSGEPAWAAAVVMVAGRVIAAADTTGLAPAPYLPGLLAAREGPILEEAIRSLARRPDVLLVNAAGSDHPRRAGLAMHLGWALDLPTVGVTHRPFVASGEWPGPWTGSRSPLWIDGRQVGWWVRSRQGTRPLAVSPGWRTGLESTAEILEAAGGRARTPEPLRQARRRARTARERAAGRERPAGPDAGPGSPGKPTIG